MTKEGLEKLTDTQLRDQQTHNATAAKALKADNALLNAELIRRYTPAIKTAYTAAGKTTGKITVDVAGFGANAPIKADVEAKMSVEWDQAKLRAAGDAMTAEEAGHIIKVEMSVLESVYKALPPGMVKTALTAARTTKLSAPSIKFKTEE